MQPSLSITITCDSLVEFEEEAATFAQGEPEFVNGAVSAVTGESAPANSSSPRLRSDLKPEA
jgi:hypothetical protein